MPRQSTFVSLSAIPLSALSLSALLLVTTVALSGCSESSAEAKKPPLAATGSGTVATDPFAIPDGNADELFSYIDRLRSFRPTTNEEVELYSEKAPQAIADAADKIMAMVPDEKSDVHVRAACISVDMRISNFANVTPEQRQAAAEDVLELIRAAAKVSPQEAAYHNERLMYLITELRATRDLELAAKTLREAADILVSTDHPQLADVAEQMRMQATMVGLPVASEKQQREILDQTVAKVTAVKDKLGETEFNMIRILIQELEETGNAKLTTKAYRDFAKVLRDSGNSELSADAAYFETMGQPMDLEGTTHDGTTFDWSAYRGKVVLVNFWATWCTPCIKKIPELQAMHEEYKQRGFEIVGISLDHEKEALTNYMTSKGMPWTVLHHPGGQHPAAMRYHVESLPYTLLLDEQGHVVARNPTLADITDKLDELLERHPTDSAAN